MKNLFKLNFRLLTNILILLVFIVGGLSYADSNGVWTYASDVTNGTFGADQQILGMNYSFINPVYFYDSLIGYANKSVTKGLLANGVSGYSNNNKGSAIYGYASYGAYSGYFEDGPFVINQYNGKTLTFRNGILTVSKTIITNDLNSASINTTTLNSTSISNKGNIQTTSLNSNNISTSVLVTNKIYSTSIDNKGNIQTTSLNSNTINTNTLNVKKIYLNGKPVVTAPPICDGQNQFLQWTGNNWLCGSVAFPAPPSTCSLDGVTFASGTSHSFYNTTISASCSSQSRLCTNGVIGGNPVYQYKICNAPTSPLTSLDCSVSRTLYDGTVKTTIVKNGTSQIFYLRGLVIHGTLPPGGISLTPIPNGVCTSQSRTCINGAIDGSYTYPSCTVVYLPICLNYCRGVGSHRICSTSLPPSLVSSCI